MARFQRALYGDVIVIGGGISAAMVAEKLASTTSAHIVVVEAGNRIFNLDQRFAHRERQIAYGENPWPDDHVPGQTGHGLQSRSMAVGGQALHWGGTTPRFTPEDFRIASMYGIGDDWPFDYDDLEPFYQEAEERIGVAGEQGPDDLDLRSRPYPMPPIPLSYTLDRLKEWAEKSGIPFWTNPVAKTSVPYKGRNVCTRCDTCSICPTGAKYSPDFSFQALLATGRIELFSRTLVRRLVLEEGSDRIDHAVAVDRDNPEETLHLHARAFVLASGFAWSPHLLLLSANSRFPDGLANRSGLVGKYMTGHSSVSAFAEVPEKLYPGMYQQHSLLSKRFQRPGPLDRYVRHDLRVWEATTGRQPRLRNDNGETLWGRRRHGRLAQPQPNRRGASTLLLRRASGPRQRVGPESRPDQRLGRSHAPHHLSRQRGVHRASRAHDRDHPQHPHPHHHRRRRLDPVDERFRHPRPSGRRLPRRERSRHQCCRRLGPHPRSREPVRRRGAHRRDRRLHQRDVDLLAVAAGA